MEISRSERKRRIKQLEQLIREISALPERVIAQIPCDAETRELFMQAAGMKGGDRNRQVKYITKLLKHEPVEKLYTFLSNRKGGALQENKEFHELEFYRDALLNEAIDLYREAQENQEELNEERPGRVVGEISKKFPGIDQKALTSLAWLFARTRNRRHSREIFRLLRSVHEQKKFLKT